MFTCALVFRSESSSPSLSCDCSFQTSNSWFSQVLPLIKWKCILRIVPSFARRKRCMLNWFNQHLSVLSLNPLNLFRFEPFIAAASWRLFICGQTTTKRRVSNPGAGSPFFQMSRRRSPCQCVSWKWSIAASFSLRVSADARESVT